MWAFVLKKVIIIYFKLETLTCSLGAFGNFTSTNLGAKASSLDNNTGTSPLQSHTSIENSIYSSLLDLAHPTNRNKQDINISIVKNL